MEQDCGLQSKSRKNAAFKPPQMSLDTMVPQVNSVLVLQDLHLQSYKSETHQSLPTKPIPCNFKSPPFQQNSKYLCQPMNQGLGIPFLLEMGIWQGLCLPSPEPEGSQAPQDNCNLGKLRPAFLPKNSSPC